MDYLIYHFEELPFSQEEALSMLPGEEQAERLRRGKTALFSRAILRMELARRSHCAPQDVLIRPGEHGKPFSPGIHFNISHSRDCLCLAFHHAEIGVDVEYIRTRDFQQLAPRFMAEEQWLAFRARGCPEHEFYDCWCASEALVKHAGESMWNAKQYPFIYRQGRIIPLFDTTLQIRLFSPMPGYCGALVY